MLTVRDAAREAWVAQAAAAAVAETPENDSPAGSGPRSGQIAKRAGPPHNLQGVMAKKRKLQGLQKAKEQMALEALHATSQEQKKAEDDEAETQVPLPPMPIESSRPMFMSIAGTTCTGWSGAGKSLRFADPSEVVK